jgi:hypothetical protein
MSTSYTSVNLGNGQTYKANSSNQRITGADGTETVVIAAGVWNTVITAAVERVTLGVNLFDTRAYVSNGQIVIAVLGKGTELTINPAASGTQLNFADGGVATITRTSSGAFSMHYDTINMPQNSSIWLPNGDVVVHGSSGNESLNMDANLRNVVVDAAVDQINFGVSYSAFSLVPGAGQMRIKDAAGAMVAQLSVASGHTETLSFNNARGTLGLGSGGNATFTLTDLLLDTNQAYTASQSNLKIYGNLGAESVTLSNAVSNETIDSRVEKVVFPAAFSTYTYKTGTSDLQVFNAANTLVADIYVPHTSTGTQLQFANGSWTVGYANGVLGLSVSGAATAPTSNTSVTIPTTNATGLQYSVSWGSFSSSQSGIQACLNKAMADLGKHFNAKGVLDLQVLPETVASKVLAETSPAIVKTSSTSETTEFQLESTSGVDSNGSRFDAVVYVNLANLASLNLDPTKAPSANQFDLTTILEHELLHALGFTGEIGNSASVTSPYDSLVRYTNGVPYFVGSHAQTLYGGPVPLAPASAGTGSAYYHVELSGDLMSAAISPGQVRTISSLDLAMLQDIGDPVLVGVPSV